MYSVIYLDAFSKEFVIMFKIIIFIFVYFSMAVVLKQGHSCVGKSIFGMLAGMKENWDRIEQFARIKRDKPLEQHVIEELGLQFNKLTGNEENF